MKPEPYHTEEEKTIIQEMNYIRELEQIDAKLRLLNNMLITSMQPKKTPDEKKHIEGMIDGLRWVTKEKHIPRF